MVKFLFSQDYIKWYLITLKLNQTLEQTQKQNAQPFRILTNGQGKGHVEEDWIISIKEKLQKASVEHRAGASSWSKVCIYRIPKCLRDAGDDKAYFPEVVSLGPYHHGEWQLCNMEPHKWRALNRILERNNQPIELYLDEMKKLEEKARHCYDEPIMLSSNQFVEMMVLDSAFFFEIICGATGGFYQLGYSINDPIFGWRPILEKILDDLIKLENQIPMFILDRLFGVQNGNLKQKGVIAKLAVKPFQPPTFDPLPEKDGLHVLQVLRQKLLTRQGTRTSLNSNRYHVPDKRHKQHCVTELKEAGVKFKRRDSTYKFWEIEFKSGVLEIPQLLIHDGTKPLFLNLIAYEQCHMDSTDEITAYVSFMDNLIDKPADVSYLRNCGIIDHLLGSDAVVAELFNKMGREVVLDIDSHYLSGLSAQVNEYYDHKWNTWRAILKHRYFNSPWTVISLLAAVALLLLTVIQTVYTVYPYYKPSS